MRVAIYARVSTLHQERDQTIDSQLAALRAWVEQRAHDLRPEHVFTDPGYSGGRLDRPGLDRLRDAAAGGEFDTVAVCSPDRLARRYVHQALLLEEFRKARCAVAFVHREISDDPHDQLLLQIQGALAEYERSVIAERFRRGKLQRARAGHWVAGRAAYGYRYFPKRDGVPGFLVIDDAQAEAVRAMFRRLVDERLSLRAIAQRLAESPWRPKNGKRVWSLVVIHRICPTRCTPAPDTPTGSSSPRLPTRGGGPAARTPGRAAGNVRGRSGSPSRCRPSSTPPPTSGRSPSWPATGPCAGGMAGTSPCSGACSRAGGAGGR
jgi:site-specific DNA recombinase